MCTGHPGKHKRVVWMVARQHPGEAMAEWFVEGFLNRLTDPHDAAAMRVLENAVFYVVRACSLNRIAPGQAWVLTSFSFCVIMHEASLSSCAALLTVSWLLVGKLLGSSILCFSYYALMSQCSQCVATCGQVWIAAFDWSASTHLLQASCVCTLSANAPSCLQRSAPCQPCCCSTQRVACAPCTTL